MKKNVMCYFLTELWIKQWKGALTWPAALCLYEHSSIDLNQYQVGAHRYSSSAFSPLPPMQT